MNKSQRILQDTPNPQIDNSHIVFLPCRKIKLYLTQNSQHMTGPAVKDRYFDGHHSQQML